MNIKQEYQQSRANLSIRNSLRKRIARAGFELGHYHSEHEGWIATDDYTMRELWEICRKLDAEF